MTTSARFEANPFDTDPTAPQTFYEFEIVRPDGRTQRIVISEEGQFCSSPSQAIEIHVDPLRSWGPAQRASIASPTPTR